MIVSTQIIKFRIDIDFENCNVDMVFKEARNNGYSGIVPHILCGEDRTIPNENTPIDGTVDFALNWLSGFVDKEEMCTTMSKRYETELEEIGVSVESTYGLMMGTCHLICETDINNFSKELIVKCENIVLEVFKQFVMFYNGKKELNFKQLQLELFEAEVATQ